MEHPQEINEKMIRTGDGEQFTVRERKSKPPRLLIALSAIIIGIGLVSIIAVIYGFVSGDLVKHWNSLSEGQASIIGNLLFLYGATFAAVVAPLLFSERIRDTQEQLQELSMEISSLSKSTRLHFTTVQQQLLRSAGYKVEYSAEDLSDAKSIIALAKQDASDISRFIFSQGSLNKRQRAKFHRKWPGKATYSKLLYDEGLIDRDVERALNEIDSAPSNTTNLVELNAIARNWNAVKEYANLYYDY